MNIIDRFWSKVSIGKPDDCWEWQGCFTPKVGYGAFKVGGKTFGAHRVSWVLTHGNIDGDLCVCHTCDNRKCVNPNHLFLGTKADNHHDGTLKGRMVNPPKLEGEDHPMHKLSRRDVLDIRNEFSNGNVTKAELAKKHGVTATQIYHIVSGIHWKE